jgi:alanine-synthesizing transaminase
LCSGPYRTPAAEISAADSPGIGFGDYGGNVRFALIENEERTRQALRGIKQMLAKGVVHA